MGLVASEQESEVFCIAPHAEQYIAALHPWLSGFMRLDKTSLQPYSWYHLELYCHCLSLLRKTVPGCQM